MYFSLFFSWFGIEDRRECLLALSWIDIKQKRKHCQWENPFIHIQWIYKEKLKKKKQWNWRWEKMGKVIK